jgi:Kef-type K+ transport system membrane component KefB
MGRLAALVGMPTLVGEIISGFLLGPPVANFVPYPEAMVLIGQIGLIGLLLEAGVVMDVGQLKQSGLRAFFLASTGAFLPLIGGIGLGYALGVDLRSAIAVGASFSPTSLGVASNALAAGNVYNTPVGQLIVAACVIDDIIGLIFLSVIQVLVNEDAQSWEYAIPVISSFGYLLILGYAAVTWMPIVIEKHILTRVPEQSRDLLAFGLMIMLTLIYLPILNYSRSSYLTGAFLAGLTFSQIHSVHDKFANEGAIIMQWLLRIFFSASIGFQIPIKMFGDPQVIIWGLLICGYRHFLNLLLFESSSSNPLASSSSLFNQMY